MTERQVSNVGDDYASRLMKLIPSEVSAAYLAINSIVPLTQGFDFKILLAIGCLTVICPVYLWLFQKVRGLPQLIFTTAMFPLWAVNISNGRSNDIDPQLVGIVLILATLVIPLVPMKTVVTGGANAP